MELQDFTFWRLRSQIVAHRRLSPVLHARYDRVKHYVFLRLLDAAFARRVQPVDQAVDEPRLLKLRRVRSLIEPVLVVIELGAVLAETRLMDHLVAAKIIAERVWLVVIVVTSVVEVDVAVSAGAICASHRHVLSAKKEQFCTR